MHEDLKIKVLNIVAKVLNLESSSLTSDASMLNISQWDSLAHLSIITSIERELGFQFDIDDIAVVISVGDIQSLVTKYHRRVL